MGSQYGVNKKEFQSRSQEKNAKNMPGSNSKEILVYRQKNKPYTEDRTKAEVNVRKIVKCKHSK
jgi:hypothetical protein